MGREKFANLLRWLFPYIKMPGVCYASLQKFNNNPLPTKGSLHASGLRLNLVSEVLGSDSGWTVAIIVF